MVYCVFLFCFECGSSYEKNFAIANITRARKRAFIDGIAHILRESFISLLILPQANQQKQLIFMRKRSPRTWLCSCFLASSFRSLQINIVCKSINDAEHTCHALIDHSSWFRLQLNCVFYFSLILFLFYHQFLPHKKLKLNGPMAKVCWRKLNVPNAHTLW